jgi:hypothetical protein
MHSADDLTCQKFAGGNEASICPVVPRHLCHLAFPIL